MTIYQAVKKLKEHREKHGIRCNEHRKGGCYYLGSTDKLIWRTLDGKVPLAEEMYFWELASNSWCLVRLED